MHIPDGYLTVPVAAAGYALSAAAVGWALRKLRSELDDRLVPVIGMMSALIFAAQMLNFPVAGGTSGHLMGTALAVTVLGPAAGMLTITLVLGLQCLLFADGGLTALGANVLNMAVVGCLVTALVLAAGGRAVSSRRPRLMAATALAAFLSVVLASAACSVELALSGTAALAVTLPAMVGVHALIGIGEATITVAAVGMLLSVRPDLVAAWQGGRMARPAADTGGPR